MASRPATTAPAPAQPLTHLVVATPDADHDLLAQLLAGEMALNRTDLAGAAAFFGKAMMLSNEPEVAERAAGLATAVHDDAAAQRALDRWQSLGAEPAALAAGRAQLALDRGDGDEAARQLQRLLDSGDKDAWRQLGRVLLAARDQAQAGRLLEKLATAQRLPADPKAWLAMSELGDKLGRPAYAMQIAQAAMERFKSPETYAWAAQMTFRQGDHAAARALLRQAVARHPESTALRMGYAGMLSQAGDNAAALRVLDRGPQDADTYALRASLAARADDDKAIAALYQQLQKASPDVHRHNAYLLGQLAQMQHRDAEALTWYDQVADDDPHAFDADLRTAVILQSQGHSAEAHELLSQLQMSYLDQPDQLRQAYQVDAELYMREQHFTLAEAAFNRALQVVPNDPGLLYGRGLAYAEAGKVDQAVKDFEHLLKIKPDDIDASNALGYTLADADRDLPQAEKLLRAARAAKPHDPAIADSWGWLQYRLGHLDQAVEVLRGAWQARKDADVGVHLGEVLWKKGQQQEARKLFDEVRKLDPHSSMLRETLKRLQP
ncbi:MAG TPA: tetratricopeptide repeat protein [Rhodanobacter sp.]|nr:tetratricopeptide repeat protein [Rhodanobacter sp.]